MWTRSISISLLSWALHVLPTGINKTVSTLAEYSNSFLNDAVQTYGAIELPSVSESAE